MVVPLILDHTCCLKNKAFLNVASKEALVLFSYIIKLRFGSQSVRCSFFVSISDEPISHAENLVKAVGLYIMFCIMVFSMLKFLFHIFA